jgi:hypothetical protein
MKEKRHQTRRNLRLARWRPGEKPVRHWDIVLHLVKGITAIEIGAIVRRRPEVVRQICSKLGLSQAPRHYDLGDPFKLARMAELYSATGLDRESFARCFGVPSLLLRRIADRPLERRVSPSHAALIVKARDEIIHATYEITRRKGANRWAPGSYGVLRSLVPDFPRVFASLRNLLSKSRRFLRTDPSAEIEQWQDWLCQQARLESAGSLPGTSFVRSLPLAVELSQFIEARLPELRTEGRLWQMSTEILAARFNVSAFVINHCIYAHALPPRDVESWILRTRLRQWPSSIPSPAVAKETREARERKRKQYELGDPCRFASMVEQRLAGGQRSHKAIEMARKAVWGDLCKSKDEKDHIEYDTLAQYHQRHLRRLRKEAEPRTN